MRITAGGATAPLVLCCPCTTCMPLHGRSCLRTGRILTTDVPTRWQIYAEAPKLVPTPQTMFGGRRRVSTDRDYAPCIRMSGIQGEGKEIAGFPLTFTDCASRSVVRHFYFCHGHLSINLFFTNFFLPSFFRSMLSPPRNHIRF